MKLDKTGQGCTKHNSTNIGAQCICTQLVCNKQAHFIKTVIILTCLIEITAPDFGSLILTSLLPQSPLNQWVPTGIGMPGK